MELLAIAREGQLLLPGVDALQISSTLVPETLRAKIRDRLTPNLCIAYGISEIGFVTFATPAQLAADAPGSVGSLGPGVETRVVDSAGAVTASGGNGRLFLRAPGMIDSYLDNPEETARSFRDGWFDTGDHVEWTPGGTLIHHGRADDVMIFDGMNIYPAEIEKALLEHPAVTDAVALRVRLKSRGDIPVAAVVLGSAATSHDLMVHCKSVLGGRAPMVVKQVDAFPRNAAGKVRRQALAKAIGPAIVQSVREELSRHT